MLPISIVAERLIAEMEATETTVAQNIRDNAGNRRRDIFRHNLRAVIDASGMSQAEIARAAGVPATSLSRWLRDGIEADRTDSLTNLCAVLGVDQNSLWSATITHSPTPALSRRPPTNDLASFARDELHDKLDALLDSPHASAVIGFLRSLTVTTPRPLADTTQQPQS